MSATTTALARWLRRELQRRELTQMEASVYAGVGSATLSEILNKGHIPKVETLFRLADFFGAPREQVLRVAGHLPSEPAPAPEKTDVPTADEPLIQELLEEFRRVPDEWKPVVVEQMAQFRRLAELRPVRMVGEDEEVASEPRAVVEPADKRETSEGENDAQK